MSMFSLGLAGFSQTINDAGEAFNKGIQFTKDENFPEALNSYQQTISICDKLGDEGTDLKLKAQQQLPSTYYNLAKSLYKEKKYNDALANFELSANWADQMGEDKTADAARTYLAGIYTAIGNSGYKKDEFDKALEDYNKALTYKPDYFKAYYGIGLVYKKQEKVAEMKEAMDKVLELAPADDKTAENARSTTATTFLNEGAVALQKGSFDDAVNHLNTSLQYNDSEPLTHFYLCIAYNSKKEYDQAIDAGNKAIELGLQNTGDAWFEIGKAYEGKGDTAGACEAYKKVTSGPNVQAAKYQAEQVLKCQ